MLPSGLPSLANVGKAVLDELSRHRQLPHHWFHAITQSSTAIERPNVKGHYKALLHGHYFQFSDNFRGIVLGFQKHNVNISVCAPLSIHLIVGSCR